jgi:cellulose synthase/poly-beta-1,6-N-acetylglucosamine synthase-like glycosyltransferase
MTSTFFAHALSIISYGLLIYFIFANSVAFILLCASGISIWKTNRTRPMIESLREGSQLFAPSISVIAPAYNEERSILESVHSFLSLRYPKHEVIIVNDGSTDRTFELLKREFDLEARVFFRDDRLESKKILGTYISRKFPNLIVIDKENGCGKADANNAGIAFARNELICAVDSDCILDEDSLIKVVIPFIEEPTLTVASGGTVRPVNGSLVRRGRVVKPRLPRNPLALIQIVEYLRAFMFGRLGWNLFNSTLIISGAFGLFKKEAMIEVGGYQSGSLAEDMDMVVKLRRHFVNAGKYVIIAFVPDPICWTEVPSTLGSLSRQRKRWQTGLADTLIIFRAMILNSKFGFAGLVALPYFFLVELLGPAIEIFSYLVIGLGFAFKLIDLDLFLLFILVDLGYGMLMSIGAVLMEESAFHKFPKMSQLFVLVVISFFEHLGYRQFNSFQRLVALLTYGQREKVWGKMDRVGFESG